MMQGGKQMNKDELIESAGKMAKELAQFTQDPDFDEEALLDVLGDSLKTKFKVLNEQFSLKYDGNPIESIHSRVKDYDSIMRKIIRKKIPRTLEAIEENINDIAGVRVICSFVDDIYRLADCLLRQDDIILLRSKDYIKNPKPTGYRSLHLIVAVPIFLENEKKLVKVEVQFRTIAMDFWASLEHKLRYKKNISEEMLNKLSHELTDCANVSASLDNRMQNVRNLLFSETQRVSNI